MPRTTCSNIETRTGFIAESKAKPKVRLGIELTRILPSHLIQWTKELYSLSLDGHSSPTSRSKSATLNWTTRYMTPSKSWVLRGCVLREIIPKGLLTSSLVGHHGEGDQVAFQETISQIVSPVTVHNLIRVFSLSVQPPGQGQAVWQWNHRKHCKPLRRSHQGL